MRLLRAYLIILNKYKELNVTVHRDLNSLIETWNREKAVYNNCSALIHIGFDRPTSESVIQLLTNLPRKVLVTESARWALPREFRVYARKIGSCKCRDDSRDISVYIATKGWGYQYIEEDLELEIAQIVSKIDAPSGWVKQLSLDCPDLYLVLAENRISDENEYLKFRNRLSDDIRNKIEATRFKYFRDSIREKNLWGLLKIAPSQFLKIELSDLDLTVRLNNIFRKYHIKVIGDLLHYNFESLLMLKNFGWKSLADLTEIIRNELLNRFYDQNLSENSNMSLQSEKANDLTDNNLSKDDRLILLFREVLQAFDDRDRQILFDRFGYSGNRLTLEQIGKIHGLTRERVRQIESNIIEKLSKTKKIEKKIIDKIDSILKNRNNPLLLELLETEDEWFKGFFGKYNFLASVIENLSGNKFHVIKVLGRNIISRISQNNWDNLVSSTQELLRDNEVTGLKKSEINLLIESMASKYDVPELGGLLKEVLKDKIVFAFQEKDESEIFIGYGATVEQLVLSVLTESDSPLHYTEIARRINEKYSKSIRTNIVHNSALTAGAKLFGRGTYGLIKHMPFERNEIDDILDTVEGIMSKHNIDKQWQCQELVNLFFEKRPDFYETLNPYTLNIILEKSDKLVSLGRQVWTFRRREVKTKPSRIDISQAYISILEEAGKPLREKELKRRISIKRGINPNQQIYPTDRMVQILPGLWGLIDRDIPVSQEEQEKLLNVLYIALQRREKAIHVKEIQSSIEDLGFSFPKALNPYTLFRLAQNDSRFKVGYGQLLGLRTWKELNRLSLTQAVKNVIKNSSYMTLDEIWKSAEKLAERSVDKQSVVSILQNLGANYNKEAGHWEFSSKK